MPDTERPTPLTPEARAHLYEHGSLTCAVPRCSLCPELAKQFRAAEAPLRERIAALRDALRIADAVLMQTELFKGTPPGLVRSCATARRELANALGEETENG